MSEEKYPKNFQAILDWCQENRPDLKPVVEAERNNDGFILLMTVGFEAGRRFQFQNPGFPFTDPSGYCFTEHAAPAAKESLDALREVAFRLKLLLDDPRPSNTYWQTAYADEMRFITEFWKREQEKKV